MKESMRSARVDRLHGLLTVVLAVLMILIGIQHFVDPATFMLIVPDWLPAPRALVFISGFFEIAGGLGLLLPRMRRAASFGLVALYIAVFPANVHMAVHGIQLDPQNPMPEWAMWLRLPMQGLVIAWAWWAGRYVSPASMAKRGASK